MLQVTGYREKVYGDFPVTCNLEPVTLSKNKQVLFI
jgi:hypothetical protein